MTSTCRIKLLPLAAALWLLASVFPTFAQEQKAKMAEKPKPPARPEITRIEPRGLQRASTLKFKLTGKELGGLKEVKFHHESLQGKLLAEPGAKATEAWIEVTAAPNAARQTVEVSVVNEGGESGRLKLFIDDLPHVYEADTALTRVDALPASFWGTLNPPGDTDEIAFEARRGQTLVFDLQARVLGSKAANAMLTLLDTEGRVLASNTGFDDTGDPLIAHRFERSGRYSIRVSDLQLAASPDHYYRLSIGEFPYVTGVFPLAVKAGETTAVELVGHNLPRRAGVELRPEKAGEQAVELDAETFRSRKEFKVQVTDAVELVEAEPNDEPRRARTLPVPGSVNGRIWPTSRRQETDVDLFRFEARAGQQFVIETMAARRGSLVDTKVEVLHEDGRPVERLLLQAVRDSAVTFRAIDSVTVDVRVDNWEEMDLNQFLYLQGEVCKITRMPRGPDSGLNFFSNRGQRRAWFDTTPTAHANEEPVYVVEPHPLGAKLVPNGLPVFTLHYANDDDGERELGRDSRVHFTAPAEGSYLVRVTDSRGFGGDLFAYRLSIREAKPDFKVTLVGADAKVPPGNGTGFLLRADRIDGFTGPIRVDITGTLPGFVFTTPIVIEENQLEADGTVFAQHDAQAPTSEQLKQLKLTATARIAGQDMTRPVNSFTKITLDKEPRLYLKLEPDGAPTIPANSLLSTRQPLEIVIAPGQIVPAWLRVERNGETNLLSLDVDNLPHGIIVDNIGLNGVQIRAGEDEREIFLNARPWVPEQDRLCHAVLGSARTGDGSTGNQTSFPVMIKVRKSAGATAGAR